MRKAIRIIIPIVAFCLLFFGMAKLLRFLLTDDTESYTRVTFHEMYKQDNIDVLFVGSSHVYRGIDPKIMDEQLGCNTFNAGTSAQDLDGSLMVIREAARHNDIRHIYLDLYFYFAYGEYKDRTSLSQTYIISDYLHPSVRKVKYLLDASTSEHYANSMLVARRNWDKILAPNEVMNLLKKKLTKAYINYGYQYLGDEHEWYEGKGYVATDTKVENWNFFEKMNWASRDVSQISESWKSSLKEIIAFCDREGIALTLVSAPMSNYLLTCAGNYDDFINKVRELISGTGVEYYDFNLCREEYFPSKSELYMDNNHINRDGVEIYCKALAQLINGEVGEAEMFYDSCAAKLADISEEIYGIKYSEHSTGDGKTTMQCTVITNAPNAELEVTVWGKDGALILQQDYSVERSFTIPTIAEGKCLVKLKLEDGTVRERCIGI